MTKQLLSRPRPDVHTHTAPPGKNSNSDSNICLPGWLSLRGHYRPSNAPPIVRRPTLADRSRASCPRLHRRAGLGTIGENLDARRVLGGGVTWTCQKLCSWQHAEFSSCYAKNGPLFVVHGRELFDLFHGELGVADVHRGTSAHGRSKHMPRRSTKPSRSTKRRKF